MHKHNVRYFHLLAEFCIPSPPIMPAGAANRLVSFLLGENPRMCVQQTDARLPSAAPAKMRVRVAVARNMCESTCPCLLLSGVRRVRAGEGEARGRGFPLSVFYRWTALKRRRRRTAAVGPAHPLPFAGLLLHRPQEGEWQKEGNLPQTAPLIKIKKKRKVAAPSRWCVVSGPVIKMADVHD